jgi:hypothetical protein
MERVVFFTLVSDNYYYPIGAPSFINSFKKFHPDIDLVVFRQDVIDKVFQEKGINFYMAKPTFAKLLTDKYDLVVNIDVDHAIFGRLDEVLKDDYDVGAASNFNEYENRTLPGITEEMYLQAGLVGSRDKKFWDIWEEANKDAMKYTWQENDILNKVWYNDTYVKKLNRKIYDKDIPDFYGCKSLGQEPNFYLKDNKVMCGKGEVKAYHQARGAMFPKLDFFVKELGFTWEVANYWEKLSMDGISVKYTTL